MLVLNHRDPTSVASNRRVPGYDPTVEVCSYLFAGSADGYQKTSPDTDIYIYIYVYTQLIYSFYILIYIYIYIYILIDISTYIYIYT